MTRTAPTRPTYAEIDLDALGRNVARLADLVAPSEVHVVVKADGYGHGANEVARAALGAGAAGLCVAYVDEGVALREAGVTDPVHVLYEGSAATFATCAAHDLEPTVHRPGGIDAAITAGVARMHLHVDTGLHRSGCAVADAPDLARRAGHRLASVWTHLAVADQPDDSFTSVQLDRFDALVADLRDAGIDCPVHAANSAGAIAHPRSRYDRVRVGIAAYGITPSADVDDPGLTPVMRLVSHVGELRCVPKGDTVSYGRRWTAHEDTWVAGVPLGYADGVPRRLTGVDVLIGGRRRSVVGTVTMDQVMVAIGSTCDVGVGDEVVLLGSQGAEHVGAQEWAELLGTIPYEVTCAISARVPRWHRP